MVAGKAIPESVQWIIIRLSTIMAVDDIATYTDVGTRSVKRILAHFRQTGDVDIAKRAGLHLHRTLCDYDIQHLHTIVNDRPDVYLDELRQELQDTCGVNVSESTVWRTLFKGGYTIKKLSRVAIERSAAKRAEFAARIGTYEAHQLIFVDESAVDRRMTYRGQAWAIRGRKASRKAFFCRGRRFSVLPALSLNDGIIHCDIVEGAFNTESFYEFVNHLLDQMQPFPASNSVIVMDNCKIHKNSIILDLIEARGMRYEFLPPYSPDYNPIELVFSAMKYHLRRKGEYMRFAMTELSDVDIHCALLEALCQITPADVFGWFRHCGYV